MSNQPLPASKLSEKYELQGAPNAISFFDYIIDSYDNGVKKQAFRLYGEMIEHNKVAFAEWVVQAGRADVLVYLMQQLATYQEAPPETLAEITEDSTLAETMQALKLEHEQAEKDGRISDKVWYRRAHADIKNLIDSGSF